MTGNNSRYLAERSEANTSHLFFSRAQRAWLGYALSIALYALVFSLWQADSVPAPVHALGVLIAAMCLFPLALWTARGSREIPAFELICIAYLLAFSSPLYFQKNQMVIMDQMDRFTWEETYRTLFLVATGVASLLIGYYTVFFNRISFRSFQLDLPLHPRKRLLFLKIALVIGFGLIVLRGIGVDLSSGSLNALVALLQNQAYVAIVLLAYRVFNKQEGKGWQFTLYAATTLAALFGLASGMLENALVPMLLLVVVLWNVKRRVPVALFVMGLVVFVVLNSVKMSYRSQTWQANTHAGVVERLNLWLDLAQNSTSGSQDGGGAEETFRHSMSRFDLLHQFVRVQRLTPSVIPFYGGQTYDYLLYGWIPRFLWPDKPVAQQSIISASVDYGFLTKEQTATTAIGVGHLPEAYINFGLTGIIIIMMIQGAFFALVGKVFNGPQSEGGKAIYLSLMVFFFNGIGSATASIFMLIVVPSLVNALIMRFFATGWRAEQPRKRRIA